MVGFFMRSSSNPIDKAILALSTACGIAHAVFFTLYVGKTLFGDFGWGRTGLAIGAALGFALNFVGYSLVRYGGRFPVKKFGVLAIAGSTLLASLLLVFAGFSA
jgi:hypothetical protein